MRVLKSLILVVCLAVSVMAQDTPADNWSQFRGNHSLTGVSQSNVPTSLKQLWTYEAGESIESSAAIVGGTVFVGSQKGELVALSLETDRSTGNSRRDRRSASRHQPTATAWSSLVIWRLDKCAERVRR